MKFVVDPVSDESVLLKPLNAGETFAKKAQVQNVEFHFSDSPNPLVLANDMNAFVQTVGYAYDRHVKLSLGPQHFWLLIAKGVSQHVNKHADRLRTNLVDHEGKKEIWVRDDSLRRGEESAGWGNSIPQFVSQLPEELGALFMEPFSCSTPADTVASGITLMETLQQYYEYGMMTCCGIPEITLEGCPDDWKALDARVDALRKIDTDDKHYVAWLDALQELTREFMRASSGDPDIPLWQNFFKVQDMSGGPYISGWINTLFPYDKSGHPLRLATDWRSECFAFCIV